MNPEGQPKFDESFPADFCIDSALPRLHEARSGQHDPRQQALYAALRDAAVTSLNMAVASGVGSVVIRIPVPLGKYYRYAFCRVLEQRFGFRLLRWTRHSTPSAEDWKPWGNTQEASEARHVKIVIDENEKL